MERCYDNKGKRPIKLLDVGYKLYKEGNMKDTQSCAESRYCNTANDFIHLMARNNGILEEHYT